MKITVNGTEKTIDPAIGGTTTLEQLFEQFHISRQDSGIAVVLNDQVIPKQEWQWTAIRAGDRIELVHAVQGG